MTAVLEVSGLRYRYPDGRRALDGVDLRVDAGERVALLLGQVDRSRGGAHDRHSGGLGVVERPSISPRVLF